MQITHKFCNAVWQNSWLKIENLWSILIVFLCYYAITLTSCVSTSPISSTIIEGLSWMGQCQNTYLNQPLFQQSEIFYYHFVQSNIIFYFFSNLVNGVVIWEAIPTNLVYKQASPKTTLYLMTVNGCPTFFIYLVFYWVHRDAFIWSNMLLIIFLKPKCHPKTQPWFFQSIVWKG